MQKGNTAIRTLYYQTFEAKVFLYPSNRSYQENYIELRVEYSMAMYKLGLMTFLCGPFDWRNENKEISYK